MDETLIDVEVAYATPEQQVIVALKMPEGATVEQAIHASGLLNRFPEIDGADLKVGIFGSVCKLDQPLRQADRVEIYRPLIHDPKEARRQRASRFF
jgi:putative ubiquitin-RnfH superfamily antitoxin RatB of RatAB toxin-antitoxin module